MVVQPVLITLPQFHSRTHTNLTLLFVNSLNVYTLRFVRLNKKRFFVVRLYRAIKNLFFILLRVPKQMHSPNRK